MNGEKFALVVSFREYLTELDVDFRELPNGQFNISIKNELKFTFWSTTNKYMIIKSSGNTMHYGLDSFKQKLGAEQMIEVIFPPVVDTISSISEPYNYDKVRYDAPPWEVVNRKKDFVERFESSCLSVQKTDWWNKLTHDQQLSFAYLGLGTEMGEVMDIYKQALAGQEFNHSELLLEVGDTLWHLVLILEMHNLTMTDAMCASDAKFRNKYPDRFEGIEKL